MHSMLARVLQRGLVVCVATTALLWRVSAKTRTVLGSRIGIHANSLAYA